MTFTTPPTAFYKSGDLLLFPIKAALQIKSLSTEWSTRHNAADRSTVNDKLIRPFVPARWAVAFNIRVLLLPAGLARSRVSGFANTKA